MAAATTKTAKAVKATAAQKGAAKSAKPRTAKQKAAALKWAAAGRAAQKAAAAGKKNVAATKTAKAPMRAALEVPGGSISSLHFLPVCGAVAVAAHLYAATGILPTDEQIVSLANKAGESSIGDLLECVAVEGFCGIRLLERCRCAPVTVPGLICGLETENGYHSVLAAPGGMLSWGLLLPWPRWPDEAWYLEWASAPEHLEIR